MESNAEEPGIVYRVELKTLESPFGQYMTLGPQQLPRPTEQCAWVTELPLGHSFENWPNVSFLEFQHDRRVSEHFLEMFDGGSKLFPTAPLAEVAFDILNSREIPKDLVEAVLTSFGGEPAGLQAQDFPALRREISNLATLMDYRRILTDQQIEPLLADSVWEERMLSEVLVRWRAIRQVPVSSAEGNPLSIPRNSH